MNSQFCSLLTCNVAYLCSEKNPLLVRLVTKLSQHYNVLISQTNQHLILHSARGMVAFKLLTVGQILRQESVPCVKLKNLIVFKSMHHCHRCVYVLVR